MHSTGESVRDNPPLDGTKGPLSNGMGGGSGGWRAGQVSWAGLAG